MPAEPREVRPYQTFDQSFRGRAAGDFRPEVIETADEDELTEDGYGGPPPPRATNLPTHPSDLSAELAATPFVTPADEPVGPGMPVPAASGTAAPATYDAPLTDEEADLPFGLSVTHPDEVAEQTEGTPIRMAPETAQEPAGFDATAPNEAVLVSMHPEFSTDADAAALADLL